MSLPGDVPVTRAWREYVLRVIGDDRQVDVSRKTGIDQSTISRWLKDDDSADRRVSIAPPAVRAFAHGYGQQVLEAFVVAGFLTTEEAGMKMPVIVDLSRVPATALAAEVRRRLLATG